MDQSGEVYEAIALRRRQSLATLVCSAIEQMILCDAIVPGDRLNEAAIAQRLGVSRGPVREALRLLERENLVVSVMHQGVYVRSMTAEDAALVYDVRAAVFGLLCREVANRYAEEQNILLAAYVDEMDDLAASLDHEAFFQVNLTFHDAIVSAAGHSRAQQTYRGLVKELKLFRRTGLMTPAGMQASNREHRSILKALRDGDEDAARSTGEEHVLNAKKRWMTAYQRPAQRTLQLGFERNRDA